MLPDSLLPEARSHLESLGRGGLRSIAKSDNEAGGGVCRQQCRCPLCLANEKEASNRRVVSRGVASRTRSNRSPPLAVSTAHPPEAEFECSTGLESCREAGGRVWSRPVYKRAETARQSGEDGRFGYAAALLQARDERSVSDSMAMNGPSKARALSFSISPPKTPARRGQRLSRRPHRQSGDAQMLQRFRPPRRRDSLMRARATRGT